ncbi:uncharacterized protein LOC107434305 isoform X1 [Ziziphus jujuba]|uniref:Uncharacterized protein LOC107434305 isoform X1 n=1 Tax=Ziziphus jujuba TaxID=326968 RepID=A0A6P4AYU6_ZIZJJ|nr:uncharacterized protein LOC107434305 isoform X1 [Ziziphus jujuba]
MDPTPTPDVEETVRSDPAPPNLDGAPDASVGDKRPVVVVENGSAGDQGLSKKPRLGTGPAGGDLKKVAEIVLVLSTMARIRGGKKPTEFEVGLMSEARAKLVELCQGLAPKDIVARDTIGAVIEDLGLNSKLKDQRLGFRGPKLTIAERLSATKKKMEEPRKYNAHPSAYSSHPMQTSFGTAAESRGVSPAMRMIPSEKPSLTQISTGGASASLPLGHVSTTPTSVQHQLPANEVRASMLSSGLPSSHLGRDSSLALPRVERTQVKPDGGPSSYASQGQVNSHANHQVNAPAWSLQTQPAKSIPENNKLPNHTSAKVDGTSEMSMPRVTPLAARDQTFRPFITQTAPGNLPSMHQPLHAMNYVQAAPLSNNHNEIAKIVQKLLQPKLPDHPTWIPPSRDYMNKALTCQSCQLTISEVDSVLICDACEKGYHIKCSQSSNQRGIPRGEWHCARCLAFSNGKPLPPKYGRVMRSNTQAKIPSSTAGVQLSSEKKVGTVDPKVSQQTMVANGSPNLQTPSHIGGGSDHVDSALDSKNPSAREMSNLSLNNQTMDDKQVSGNSPNILMKPLEAASGSHSVEPSSERSSYDVKNLESSTVEEGCPKLKSVPLTNSSNRVTNKFDHTQPSHDSQSTDQAGPPNSADVPSRELQDNNTAVKDPDKSHLFENSSYTIRYDSKRDEQDGAQKNTVESSATSTGATEHSVHSLDGLHGVEWIGDAVQVVDEKTFYHACCVNGLTYKLHDHALFRSSNGKLIPSKLQSMWEDCKTGSKWVIVNRCYFPGDLPENVGRPSPPESNEVYESNHDGTVMAGLIQGPCEVLPPVKFKEENERRSQLELEPNSALRPAFLCKWLYDEFKGSFQPVSS